MFFARLLILLIVVALLMWLLKRLFNSPPAPEQLESSQSENMLQCKYCGVHVPESSIVTAAVPRSLATFLGRLPQALTSSLGSPSAVRCAGLSSAKSDTERST